MIAAIYARKSQDQNLPVVMQERKWWDAIPLVDRVNAGFPLTVNTITGERSLDTFTVDGVTRKRFRRPADGPAGAADDTPNAPRL